MISEKINALLQFVKFLHSNINNFKRFDDIINDYNLLCTESSKLSPSKNHNDKLRSDVLQLDIDAKFNVIDVNIIQPIKLKARELNISIQTFNDVWSENIAEICAFKRSSSDDDALEILPYKSMYIELKKEVNWLGFLGTFSSDLDKILKELFDYFSEKTENKIDKIEMVEVDSLPLLQFQAGKPDELEKVLHPKHDPNLWNNDCFELFKYLFDEYYKGTIRQITNIWFYLKEYNSKRYKLYATKDSYKFFIKDNYKIEIKNFDKALLKWEEKEYEKIDEHRQNYEDGLK
ncbi:hypothetical protein [Flavobacterium sp.]|uniref:hypothetical protein n=1 Tax=Flavobacterium sp. TaxID=239 RepID=UPI002CE2ACB4|nr:hypothetical protein [Flavobacterium sp.]HSD06518.1 hypothetical protein [Flavobacterium sp.]